MTAIALLIRELYDLSDAFWQNEFNFIKSLKYYHTKRRLRLFWFHCREQWIYQCKKPSGYNNSENMLHSSESDIDFAAVEATKAYQITENFEYQQTESYNNMKIVDGVDMNTSFYEYSDVLPKYRTDQVGELSEGVSFTFTGRIAINCERFSIDFMYDNETQDVALHINPRLPQNYIVRNTKVYEVWGNEEVSSALPFQLRRGNQFAIQVLITDTCYMISVNGNHFTEYSHRIPYNGVKILEVKGDVEEVEMNRTKVETYPQRTKESAPRNIGVHLLEEIDEVDANAEEFISIPHDWCLINAPSKLPNDSATNRQNSTEPSITLPYYGTFPSHSLIEGRCIKIEGRVRLLPHSFYINLQQGRNIWPHPIIAFHLNPRFSQTSSGAIGKAVVCRNAWYNGSWAQEERSELNTKFRPGRTFSLAIVCSKDCFEVYVNRQFLTEFKYHVSPTLVDTVYIQGDIKLWNVTLESNPLIKGKNIRIYHNPIYTEEH